MYRVRKNNAVYIYYKDEFGKIKALPRKITRHLDTRTDDDINGWMRWYQQSELGIKSPPVAEMVPRKIKVAIRDFEIYLKSVEKLSHGTITQHTGNLNKYALPFFLGEGNELVNLNDWVNISPKLLEFLRNNRITPTTINRVNISLRKFYKWCRQERIVDTREELHLRNDRVGTKETPLKEIITPEEVLDYAKKTSSKLLRVSLLTGFFFALRPQEIWYVRPGLFTSGDKVEKLESYLVFQRLGMGVRLAMNVQKQSTTNEVKPAKTKGVIACYSTEAAQLLVELFREHGDPNMPFFTKTEMNAFYKRIWTYPFALKDLRRSSLYYLGHHTDIRPFELQKFARHRKFATTELYLRRPSDDMTETQTEWDL